MPMFRIGMIHRVYEDATLRIEAASQEEAETKAIERVTVGSGVEWSFLEGIDDSLEIVSCEQE